MVLKWNAALYIRLEFMLRRQMIRESRILINFYYWLVMFLYFSHFIKVNGRFTEQIFACVLWHKPGDDPDKFGNPTKTWVFALWPLPVFICAENLL